MSDFLRYAEMNLPGKLFVVEGIDGSGKTTQLGLLAKWLEAEGHRVSVTEWNSSALVKAATKAGKKKNALTPMTFSLLHATDFADRLLYKIIPPLKAGMIVLADRYAYTAFARDVARGVEALHGDSSEPRHQRRLEGLHVPARHDAERLPERGGRVVEVAAVLGELGEQARVLARVLEAVLGLRDAEAVGLQLALVDVPVARELLRELQLHARALGRLRDSLGSDATPAAMQEIRAAVLAFAKPRMAKASLRSGASTSGVAADGSASAGTVLDYASASRAARSKSPSRNGFASQRQPVSARNRSASVPATSPVTKITRRESSGRVSAIAR